MPLMVPVSLIKNSKYLFILKNVLMAGIYGVPLQIWHAESNSDTPKVHYAQKSKKLKIQDGRRRHYFLCSSV